ncbi:MAG: hypothetical protein RIB84_23765 [Sneathiellaceae bacterium]
MIPASPDKIDARAAARQRLAVAKGRRDAALEIGARRALALLQEDREALIAGEAIHDSRGRPALNADGAIRMDDEEARQRLAAYDAAIAEISRAFGELQQEVDRQAAAWRAELGIGPAAPEGRS